MSEVDYNSTPALAPLTQQEVAELAYEAGFRSLASNAAITAIVEGGPGITGQSGGVSGITGVGTDQPGGDAPYDTEYSMGLSQINVSNYGGNVPYANIQLLTPLSNLKAAYSLSKGGTDFSPWNTSATAAVAGDPEAEVAASAALGMPAAQRQSQTQSLQAAAESTLANAGYPIAPEQVSGQIPAALQSYPQTAQPASGEVASSAQGGGGQQSTPTSGTSSSGSTSYNSTAQASAFGAVLIQVDRWLNPAKPGLGSSVTSLGGSDVMWIVQLLGARIGFALPGFAGLLVAVGGSLLGLAKEVIGGRTPAAALRSQVAG